MIGPSGVVKVMVATRPVDFRKGVDGLAALVRDAIGADPFSGTRIAESHPNRRLDELLPWAYASAQDLKAVA